MFSGYKRTDIYHRLEQERLDVLVIGGGITGAGIALDAVTRGLSAGVLEMQDFAAGTSSRSTKLVHGGLRYLKQFEIKMVADVGQERETVYENGPHVTTPQWMLLPCYKDGNFGPYMTNIGLKLYDTLARVKKGERRKMLTPKETLAKEPLLKKQGLKGSGYYVEYRTDDARLTLEVLKKAVQKGAMAQNYAKVVDFIYEDGLVKGVVTEDQIDGEKREIYARKVINAAGPWVDELREKDGSNQEKSLYLTKGVHLVFNGQTFPLKQSVYFDAPDGRMIFAIPRDGKTYVGTTDTCYEGDTAHPTMTVDDRDYLIRCIEYMFPDLSITSDDVESSWAGLRPLIHEDGKDPSDISRKDEIFTSESGLISIAGGKLTGYRKMAENIVDLLAGQLSDKLGVYLPESQTEELPISGGEVGGSDGFARFMDRKIEEGRALGLAEEQARGLTQMYGANVDEVFHRYYKLKDEDMELDPLVYSMLTYGMEHELTVKPVDFFVRRTGALFFDIQWVHKHKEAAIGFMAREYEWSDEQVQEYTRELDVLLEEAVTPDPT